MSDTASGFAQFVPGFDFLQSLAKGASQGGTQMPPLANWVAPTLNPEELDKRITELKAVHFWLEQNTRALSATIQALEVQKLTLATLQGMNVGFGEVVNAFKFQPTEPAESRRASVPPVPATPSPPPEQPESAEATTTRPARKRDGKAARQDETPSGLADPLKLWGSLTQQFQEIASAALKDVAKASAGVEVPRMDSGVPSVAKGASRSRTDATRARSKAPARGAASTARPVRKRAS